MSKRKDSSPLLNIGYSAPMWESYGPINIGGRTRALAIDITVENKLNWNGINLTPIWRYSEKYKSLNFYNHDDYFGM